MVRCGTGRASDFITPLNGSPVGASFEPTSRSQRLRILPITAANEAKGKKRKEALAHDSDANRQNVFPVRLASETHPQKNQKIELESYTSVITLCPAESSRFFHFSHDEPPQRQLRALWTIVSSSPSQKISSSISFLAAAAAATAAAAAHHGVQHCTRTHLAEILFRLEDFQAHHRQLLY
jgi:hypothetical protein